MLGSCIADTVAPYIEILLGTSRVLHLSSGHFIPTATDPSHPWSRAVMKRAEDVRVGDWVWATDSAGASEGRRRNDGGDAVVVVVVVKRNNAGGNMEQFWRDLH